MLGLVRMWFTGLLAVAVIVGAVLLIRAWSERLPDPRPVSSAIAQERVPENPDGIPDDRRASADRPPPTFGERLSAWRPGADWTTAYLAGGLLLGIVALGGGRGLWWLRLKLRPATDDPRHERDAETRRIVRPDGSEIHVEFRGPRDGLPIVLTHGWGASATEWYYLRRQLGDRYRLIAWDLPGLGLSKGPSNRDFSVAKFADDLHALLAEAGDRPAILLGHSIGGMITLEFCKRYAAELRDRIAGLVLIHTSHTNPLLMTKTRWIAAPLQKPVIEPLAYLMIGLSPLVWLMNMLSYLNGSQHRSNHKQLFDGTETWGQLDFVTKYIPYVWPATYARGLLGMFHWDATDVLPHISVPTLVVAAVADKITLPEASEIIRSRCPTAKLVTLAPAGHMGLIERHEELGRAVRSFAEECAAVPVHA